ncbi:hypothetical protein [Rhodococcus rhodochrous]|uniref:hypothetical protein n=1 Tax=Rhodococcus rhodochrous TaxID=1829 RepID=UPI0024BB4089|nr:hypothetical protein [Rhodococcus rhodochrous]MDJ0400579.1 hypothetical protein [Rhodococcus rhodochrous]
MVADTAATHMARDATFVYRTDATDRAETLFDRVVAQIRDKNDDISVVSAAGPPGIPGARCFEVITPYSEGASCRPDSTQFSIATNAGTSATPHADLGGIDDTDLDPAGQKEP